MPPLIVQTHNKVRYGRTESDFRGSGPLDVWWLTSSSSNYDPPFIIVSAVVEWWPTVTAIVIVIVIKIWPTVIIVSVRMMTHDDDAGSSVWIMAESTSSTAGTLSDAVAHRNVQCTIRAPNATTNVHTQCVRPAHNAQFAMCTPRVSLCQMQSHAAQCAMCTPNVYNQCVHPMCAPNAWCA